MSVKKKKKKCNVYMVGNICSVICVLSHVFFWVAGAFACWNDEYGSCPSDILNPHVFCC